MSETTDKASPDAEMLDKQPEPVNSPAEAPPAEDVDELNSKLPSNGSDVNDNAVSDQALSNLVEFLDRREGTSLFGIAKFQNSTIKSRDYVTNGFKKYFVIGFDADKKIAYVCDCNTNIVETELLDNLKKDEGQCAVNTFLKARVQFRELLQEKENSPSSVQEKDSPSTRSHSKSIQPKKRVIPKQVKDSVPSPANRKSPRLQQPKGLKTEVKKLVPLIKNPPPTRVRRARKPPAAAKKPPAKKVSTKLDIKRAVSSESSSEDLSSEDSSSEPDLSYLKKIAIRPKEVTKLPTHADAERRSLKERNSSKETSATLKALPATPSAPVVPASTLEPNLAKPTLIPLAWHEEHMAKIRETYFRQTILNFQMAEMLQLTAPNAINTNKL